MSVLSSIKRFFTGKSKRKSMAKGKKRAKKAKTLKHGKACVKGKGRLKKGCKWVPRRKKTCRCKRK